MRQALNALGGGEDVEADESEGRLRSRAASTSMVAAPTPRSFAERRSYGSA